MAIKIMKAGDAELDLTGEGKVITKIEPLGFSSSFCARLQSSLRYTGLSNTQFDIDASGVYQGIDAGCVTNNNLYEDVLGARKFWDKFYIHSTTSDPVMLTIENV